MFEQVDLTDAKLEKEFGMGCLEIKGAHLWPTSHFVWDESANEVSATFFGDETDEWTKANLLRIEVFKLPAAKSKLADRIEWYTRYRKKRRIKVSDGMLFEESHLAIKGLGDDWELGAFPLSKGEIIRIYTQKKYAVIFRFLVRSGSILKHPIFKRVIKNITFVPGEWVRDVPEIIDTRPKSMRSKEQPMTDEQEADMWSAVGAVIKRLKLAKISDPRKRLGLLEKEVTAIQKDKKLSDDDKIEAGIELGMFLGQLYCWEMEWEWCNVRDSDGEESMCVCNPNRSLAIEPIEWICRLAADKRETVNLLLAFNMIEAGRLPPSRPYGYQRIG